MLDFDGQVWDTRAFCEAVCIQGAPGSGKSSASARYLRNAALKAGFGAVYLCAKLEEAGLLKAEIEAAGRASDIVVIDATAQERFNILDFAAAELGGEGFENNIVEVMRRMSEAARVASDKSASDGGENTYFVDNAMKWLTNAFPLLLVAEGSIRLSDLNQFIATLPNNKEELKSADWQRSYCAQVHMKVAQKSKENSEAGRYALRVINDHGIFFLTEVPNLDNRPRSSIASTLTALIYPFLTGKLNELFAKIPLSPPWHAVTGS
ncbi:hypothetical protein ACFQY5_35895 [Paeniroseomonas aquatica]|uniref:hypothetical protein n=1 Tax=Paeniroseomonas aquatica TaxID=373043 RepID=UPI00360BED64